MAFSTYKGYIKFWWQYEGRTLAAAIALPRGFETGTAYPLVVSLHGSGEIGNDNVGNLSGSVANLSTFWNTTTASYESLPAAFVLLPQMSDDEFYTADKLSDIRLRHRSHRWECHASSFRVQSILHLVRGLLAGTLTVYEDAECTTEGTLQFANTDIDDDRVMLTGFSLGAIVGWTLLREGRDIWSRAMMLEGNAIGLEYSAPTAKQLEILAMQVRRHEHIPTLLAANIFYSNDVSQTMYESMLPVHQLMAGSHYFVTANGGHVQCPGHAWDVDETFDTSVFAPQGWGTATGGTRVSGLAWLVSGDRSSLTMPADPYPYDAYDYTFSVSADAAVDIDVIADGSQVLQLTADGEKTLTLNVFGTEYVATLDNRSFAIAGQTGSTVRIVRQYMDGGLTYIKRVSLVWLGEGSDFIEILTEVYNMPVSGAEDVFYIINRGDATDGSDDNSGSSLSPTPDWSGTITLTTDSVTVTKTGDDFPVDGSLWGQWLYAAGATAGKRMHKILSNDATTLTIEKAATEDYTGTAVIGGALKTITCTFDTNRIPKQSSSGLFNRSQTFYCSGSFTEQPTIGFNDFTLVRRYVGFDTVPGDGGFVDGELRGAYLYLAPSMASGSSPTATGYLVFENFSGGIAASVTAFTGNHETCIYVKNFRILENFRLICDTTTAAPRRPLVYVANGVFETGAAISSVRFADNIVANSVVHAQCAVDSIFLFGSPLIVYAKNCLIPSALHAQNCVVSGPASNGSAENCVSTTAIASTIDNIRSIFSTGRLSDSTPVVEFDPTKMNPEMLNVARKLLLDGSPTTYDTIGPVAPRINVLNVKDSTSNAIRGA